MFFKKNKKNFSGVGLSARPQHFSELLKSPPCSWLEILIDNYIVDGPQNLVLEKLSKQYELAFHSVSLSIGSTDEFCYPLLEKIKKLCDEFQPKLLSDHLCWVSQGSHYLHDLIPIPYTHDNLKWISERVSKIQDFFNRPIALENVSSYLDYIDNDFTEAEFLNDLCKKTGCFVLLDVNNLFVNSENKKEDPSNFLNTLESKYVKQMHLAGHTERDGVLIDTHNKPIKPEVLELYKLAFKKFSAPTCIEWDSDIPDFKTMSSEMKKVKEAIESIDLMLPNKNDEKNINV